MPKNLIYVAILAWAAVSPAARSEDTVNTVRVFSDVSDAPFRVDGVLYYGVANLPWAAGSKHTVTYSETDLPSPDTWFVMKGWVTNLKSDAEPSLSQPIIASPDLQWVKLLFEKYYQLSILIPECIPSGQSCLTPGRVEVSGTGESLGSFDHSTKKYIKAGSEVELRVFANPGFIFTNWLSPSPVGSLPDLDIHFVMSRATLVAPQFQLLTTAKAPINIQANPPSMKVLMDGTRFVPPVTLEWGWGTVHTVGVEPVQSDSGVVYVFDSWSDGGAATHSIVVPSVPTTVKLMAQFVPANTVSFRTSPAGLKLSVDDRENWASYDFAWAPGSVHTISAPATQADAQGHKYRFVSWSNGQSASSTYTAGPAPGGAVVTATYQLLGQATITSKPLNLPVQVDGAACNTPCMVERDAGVAVRVSATPVLNATEQSRLLFSGWSDSANDVRVIEVSGDPRTYTATYSSQNRLSISASPAEGAVFTFDPPSPDGFYDAGLLVSVAASPALGFRIRSWSGDIGGTASLAAFTLNVPRAAVLLLDRVPAIAPLGIRSAASFAASEGVAPGSLISIFGANLAPALEVGRTNPLSQTLQTVSVRIDEMFLPLIFVSPGQINAQLPSGVSPGPHKLIVRWEGKPETSAPVLVARNAPGLFATGLPEQTLGYFINASGDAITPDRPALAGDVVTVLGTGFGPYTTVPPDGFLLDEAAGYMLVDSVRVIAGDATLNALYAGRSSAGVAVDAVRFQLTTVFPDSAFLPVKISINGQESNTVLLPISR